MNIFIDTCILYTDPFWKENFTSQLLDISKDGRVKIYLSEVVLKELRHNFQKNIDKELYDLRKSNSTLQKNLRRFRSLELPDKNECLADFDRFYQEIQTYNKVEILKCKDEFLPKVLDMAITRIKPFTEKKTELKDALIWLTYSEFVNKNNLTDCFFLTENCNDFCDIDKLKQKKYELHPDLKKDCDRFKIHISIVDFYKSNSEWLDKPKNDFKEWIKNEEIDYLYVFDLLWENKTDKISSEIQNEIDRLDPNKFFENGHLVTMGGYLEVDDIEWYECKDVEIDIVGDYAIITGTIIVYAELKAYGYNSVRDSDDDKYPYLGDKGIEVDMTFTFTIEKDGKPENFEIIDTEII